jgi:hypothetical protein
MRPRLRIIRGSARKYDRWHWRFIHGCEWGADVHWVVYPLLIVAFFWWLAYGHR